MSSLPRVVAIVLMAGQLSACLGWRVETLSPADVIRTQRPSQVRVDRRDGQRDVLYHPEVQGDSLLGWGNRALSLTEIRQVATRHVSPGRTMGLVLGVGAIVALVSAAVAAVAKAPGLNVGFPQFRAGP